MRMSDAHRRGGITISFELFPPKDSDGEAKLFGQALPALIKLEPAFVTCTYGAGGTTKAKTLETITRIRQATDLEVASHLTCVGATTEEIDTFLDHIHEQGITNVVALRGDPPKDDPGFVANPAGLRYAADLVAYLSRRGGLDVAVAGYPEGHPECPDKVADWQRCAEKVEAGAGLVITQLFYDNRDFFEFDQYLKNKMGVQVPVVPGILPILSGPQIRRFCSLCGAKVPAEVSRKLDTFGDDHIASREYGVEVATEMCQELIEYGVPGFHFYTLNRVHSTREVLQNLGLAAK
ncbi:MAG: methylenetetrahydrofolate reductase [NAD(P)H] [Phycisphaerae bacterium]|nr:methylenetetrahydrofolate reductase [NAD(P)H] [Phycisphaerae bacterium]